MGVKKGGQKSKKMKVIVLEGPFDKKAGTLDYMGFKTARSLKTGCCDAKSLSSRSRFVSDISDSSSGSCEADGFMIGCCIIHPL